ncbi:hypothetical protein M9Y10_022510 [Tritrichomonas musculus]|uniref:Dolichyl-phosphate-mannose--protein mannosyltransferase n=1 Tax=Tritrichomonas musculus TaxID=1915356 RepID=A0ABR2KTB3_9EUKA
MDSYIHLENVDLTDQDKAIDLNNDYDYQKLQTVDINANNRYDFIGVHSMRFTQADMLIIIFLTFLSFWTRNFMIQYPDKVVFDEFHFGGFTNNYINGIYFDDIHPPLGKLILFLFAKINQYDGNFDFHNKKENYEGVDYIGIRQCPALFATFCSPLIYIGLRCYGLSLLSSFTAAFMVLCENSMIVEGRFILTDGILHFFTCLSIMSTGIVLTQHPYTLSWWISLFFNGFSVGCSVSTKLTSLSLCPFIGLIHILQVIEIHQNQVIKEKKIISTDFICDIIIRACVLIFMIIFIFFTSYTFHFILLPYRGSSTSWIGYSFQKSLLDKDSPNKNWTLRTQDQSLLKNIVNLNIQMHKNNMHVTSDHPYASNWYSWPFLTGKWVLFYSEGSKHIMCHGQAFNVYAGTLTVIFIFTFGIFCLIFSKKVPHDIKVNWWLPASFAFGYCASYFPFAFIKRAMFFYHYIIPIIFGIITFTTTVDNLLINHQVIRAIILTSAQIITAIAFFFWSPWTYGIPMEDFDIRLWNKKWQM